MEKNFHIPKIPNLLRRLLKLKSLDNYNWVHQAASSTHDYAVSKHAPIGYITYERRVDGMGLGHAMWLLREIKEGQVTGNKAHRWLGWAQCILAYEDTVSLEESKTINGQVSGKI